MANQPKNFIELQNQQKIQTSNRTGGYAVDAAESSKTPLACPKRIADLTF